jgi:polysaccharide export outer membrane protein
MIGLAGCAAPIQKRTVDVPADEARPQLSNYQISPNDVVHMEVFQEPDMLTEQRVAQDGTINVALVGRVAIGGLTVDGASKVIADKLRNGFLVNPQVTVNIVEYAPRRFSVLGQVTSPGAFEIPADEILTLPTAIAMAGGNTRIGNLRRILVTRRNGGKVTEITVNLFTSAGRQFVVAKGDVIMVPESLF